MSQNKINVPSGFGGLINYGEEYESRFKIKPEHVVLFVVVVIVFVIALKLFLGTN
jgi:preprotein translocase subunit Sec61beta